MTIGAHSTLRQTVAAVSRALRTHGIAAALTGGACASVHSDGDYVSHDLDYILLAAVRQPALDAALASEGFRRDGDRYVHPESPFFVEFPRGPLAIGDDDVVSPVVFKVGATAVLGLSATDSCRDRLAAFYHWDDRQSLDAAVKVARRRRVDLRRIRTWSQREGQAAKYEEFVTELRRARFRSLND